MTAMATTVPPMISIDSAGLGLIVPTNTEVTALTMNCSSPMSPSAVPEFLRTCVRASEVTDPKPIPSPTQITKKMMKMLTMLSELVATTTARTMMPST